MIRNFSSWLRHVSSGKIALFGLVLFLAFTAFVLPVQSQKAREASNGAGSPDQSFLYSPQELYQMAETYGQQGRLDYIRARFSFDLIWPLVYAFFLTTSISWVFGRAFQDTSIWQMANILPLVGLGFDYLENISTSLVMLRYPTQTAFLAALAPFFTMIKWIFIGGSFGLLLIGLGWAALTRLQKKTNSPFDS